MGSRDQEKNNYPVQVQTRERQWTSWLIPLIVIANIVIFIIVMFVNNCPKNNTSFDPCSAKWLKRLAFQPIRQNPLLGPSSETLIKMGGLRWENVVKMHQGWRLISCIWLHAGLIHLFANMLSLVFIGIRLEQQFGFLRVGVVYVVSGFGGSILSALFLQNSAYVVSVGASGALFGLLGAMVSELLTNWTIYANKCAALFTLVIIIAVNLAVGILPFVDNFAHIGGFITGLLLGFVLLIRPRFGWFERHQLPEHARVRTKYLPCQMVLLVIALVILIAWLTVGLIMLFRGKNGNDHCSWCHYLNCVPTSKWQCNK